MSNETARGEIYTITLSKERSALYFGDFNYAYEEAKHAMHLLEMMLNFNKKHNNFYTLNDIRGRLCVDRIRAEYEMCWGYDDPKDFKYEVNIDKENQTIGIMLYNPKDLRQYMEIRDKNIE